MKSLVSNSSKFVKTVRRWDSIHPYPMEYAIVVAILLVSVGAFMPDFAADLIATIGRFSNAILAARF